MKFNAETLIASISVLRTFPPFAKIRTLQKMAIRENNRAISNVLLRHYSYHWAPVETERDNYSCRGNEVINSTPFSLAQYDAVDNAQNRRRDFTRKPKTKPPRYANNPDAIKIRLAIRKTSPNTNCDI